MDWTAKLAEANGNLATYRRAAPDAAAAFTGLHKAAMGPGSLSVLDKELMCIAIGITQHCTDCIGFHVKAAIAHGATRDQVAEVATLCIYMGGGPAYMYAVTALEAFDQLSA
jgi:AhpD family alkylhydroperoxidase